MSAPDFKSLAENMLADGDSAGNRVATAVKYLRDTHNAALEAAAVTAKNVALPAPNCYGPMFEAAVKRGAEISEAASIAIRSMKVSP